jgi:hypothetical protein
MTNKNFEVKLFFKQNYKNSFLNYVFVCETFFVELNFFRVDVKKKESLEEVLLSVGCLN